MIRENLDKQMKIVAKKKEELDAANEQRIKALEKIANLTEGEAKEQLLEAVKAKAETDAMSIKKEILMQAKINGNIRRFACCFRRRISKGLSSP